LEIIAGISQELEHVPIRWHLTLENLQQWNVAFSNPGYAEQSIDGGIKEDKPSLVNNALRHVIAGVELFPQESVNIRLGYNIRRGPELKMEDQRTFAGLSAGVGIKCGNVRFS